MAAEQVRTHLSAIGRSDIGRYFDEGGRFKPLKDIPVEDRLCIASIKTTKKNLTAGDGVQEDVVEIKLWDKLKALELMGKYHALFVERQQIEHTVTLEDVIVGVIDVAPVSSVTKSAGALPPAPPDTVDAGESR